MGIEDDGIDNAKENDCGDEAATGDGQVLEQGQVVLGLGDGKHDQASSVGKSDRFTARPLMMALQSSMASPN